ncbi:MAG: tRNA uridine-5-carboxymethylaminomethyl(34) synthesis GTPase MnmE [Clostridia bacterium]|nr:tRNA uridine-5-carboxymethylaminomethyl(34) synthesis GTPase MnmE [Clostridia bacterium]
MNRDTIAALATTPGTSGIAVVRISGTDAVKIAAEICGGQLLEANTHTAHFVKLKRKDGSIIDHAVVTVMLAPNSYTGENVVEISCHGSMTPVKEILLLLTESGARYATAGEFTKRAFLNGKMDLSQAEAVLDIINSESELALSLGVNQLEGRLSNEINKIRDDVVYLTAMLSAEADFPEEGVSGISDEVIEEKITLCIEGLGRLINSAATGELARDGIKTVIAGTPNTGKSSLLNNLVGRERAIVTNIPGTTRDSIEEYITLGHALIKLIDTAGIHDTDNEVEKIGVGIAGQAVKEADLVLFVVDLSRKMGDEDRQVLSLIEDKKIIVILNKTDIADPAAEAEYEQLFKDCRKVKISAKTGDGVDVLKNTISEMFDFQEISSGTSAVISNIRHVDAVKKAKSLIESSYDDYKMGVPADFMAVNLTAAAEALGEITGMTVSEEIVDRIFKDFCVGK